LVECPYCGEPTAGHDSFVDLCCTDNECHGRKLAKIIFFFSTCGTENIGEETFAKIFNAGFSTLNKILNITFSELIQIDGFGESVSNIVTANNKRILSGLDMATLMHASDCFEGIGKIKAQKILDEMADDELDLFYRGELTTPSEINNKLKTMQSFYRGIPSFYKFIADNKIPILPVVKKEINLNGKCVGMAVCFSGVRDDELENKIISEGGKIVGNVSKNTTILLVKDKNDTSSKIVKAKLSGIEIKEIEDFKKSL
jgi:NAD-dependent DNA ligase